MILVLLMAVGAMFLTVQLPCLPFVVVFHLDTICNALKYAAESWI